MYFNRYVYDRERERKEIDRKRKPSRRRWMNEGGGGGEIILNIFI